MSVVYKDESASIEIIPHQHNTKTVAIWIESDEVDGLIFNDYDDYIKFVVSLIEAGNKAYSKENVIILDTPKENAA